MDFKDAVELRIDKAVYDLTYSNYCQRYSSGDYSQEIDEAETRLRELCYILNLTNANIDKNRKGYLSINVDLKYYGFND